MTGLAKVTAKTAAEVCQRFTLSDTARPLLRDGMAPRQLLDQLQEKQQYVDAVNFLAHALPKREAVWWACLCVRAANAKPAPQAAAALQAAEKWVADPSEEHRRAALPAAEAADVGTPAGCAAMAAYLNSGSLAPPDLPAVPPGETLTAQMVFGAVLLSVVSTEPQKAPEKFRQALARGIEVANGTQRWK